MSTRSYSDKQEQEIAKALGGKVQSNSGGTMLGGGDVHTDALLIEAKTPMKERSSFSVKQDWLYKAEEQAFEQNKSGYALAFRFEPDGQDYYVVNSRLFKHISEMLDNEVRG